MRIYIQMEVRDDFSELTKYEKECHIIEQLEDFVESTWSWSSKQSDLQTLKDERGTT